MQTEPSTLATLMTVLGKGRPEARLHFHAPQGRAGAGYHVTELQAHAVRSIDCGTKVREWHESVLQVLDGHGEDDTQMTVGRFLAIARQSVGAIAGLQDAPLLVEFAPRNSGLRRYRVGAVASSPQALTIELVEERALCKPVALAAQAGGGCQESAVRSGCCG